MIIAGPGVRQGQGLQRSQSSCWMCIPTLLEMSGLKQMMIKA